MKKLVVLMVAALLLSAAPVWGLMDLTSGGTGTVNGAQFTTNDYGATGTGVIYSFVRISTPDTVVQGYNTDGRPLPYDENSSPTFTRSLPLSAVPIVNLGGANYREFFLDINQTKNDPNISLDRLIIWLAGTGNYKGSTLNPAGTTLVYDLDGAGDNSILLNYALNSGSGSGDMFAYIPDRLFNGGQFVYLYSQFSLNNDGFEEWAVRTATPPPPPVPEPMSLLLLGLGLLGLVGVGRFRK